MSFCEGLFKLGTIQISGMAADEAAKMALRKPTVEFTVTDTELVVRTIEDAPYINNTYTFGKECETNFGGIKSLVRMTNTQKKKINEKLIILVIIL